MIELIKKFFVKFYRKTNIVTIPDNKDIAEIKFIFDLKTDNIVTFLSINTNNFTDDEESFSLQAESFATLLNRLSGDNNYIRSLIVDSMDLLSKDSENDFLFFSNVLFFWKTKHEIQRQKERKNKFPVIRPINVFRNK